MRVLAGDDCPPPLYRLLGASAPHVAGNCLGGDAEELAWQRLERLDCRRRMYGSRRRRKRGVGEDVCTVHCRWRGVRASANRTRNRYGIHGMFAEGRADGRGDEGTVLDPTKKSEEYAEAPLTLQGYCWKRVSPYDLLVAQHRVKIPRKLNREAVQTTTVERLWPRCHHQPNPSRE